MVATNDDPPEFPNEISTSPAKQAKHGGVSLQPCRISGAVVQLLEELVYEIFLRLPVKSLIRFRCVSKGTRRLIDSPIFTKNHSIYRSVIIERDRDRSESYDDEDYAIVICQPRLHRLFSVDFDDNLYPNRAKAIEFNSTFFDNGNVCNGIFCFQKFHNSPCYVFWNPSNGTFRRVDCCSGSLSSHHVSMGYDCVNDDYKIIRETRGGLEIYSFRKDSWRKIPVPVRDRDFSRGRYGRTREVCLGGVIHWLWIDRTEKSMCIAAFDLATETFTSLPLPSEARQLQRKPSHFTDFRGRLCVTLLPAADYGPQTIWVMDKYGVESSWCKLYDFDSTTRRIRSFYFPNMKRRLLCNFKWLSWWDPQDGTFEDIEIPGLSDGFYEAYVYVRNLLRLDQTRSGQVV